MPSQSKKGTQSPANATSKDEAAKAGLPFEPVSTRKKTPKKAPAGLKAKTGQTAVSQSSPKPSPKSSPKSTLQSRSNQSSSKTMPKVVGDRMGRRMAFFCGIPSVCGMLTFVVSYILIQQGIKLPNTAVLLASLGFFGLGVLGLSYGVISSSWDEAEVGSLLGWSEFRLNVGRLITAWREARTLSKQEDS